MGERKSGRGGVCCIKKQFKEGFKEETDALSHMGKSGPEVGHVVMTSSTSLPRRMREEYMSDHLHNYTFTLPAWHWGALFN